MICAYIKIFFKLVIQKISKVSHLDEIERSLILRYVEVHTYYQIYILILYENYKSIHFRP